MACLIFGAIHHAVKGVQSGIQAHKDFKSPVQVIDPNQPRETNSNAPLDRYGHAKEHHPVYGWVMKAEHRFNKGKGRATREDGPSTREGLKETGVNKEEYENQRYQRPVGAPPAAPPTYEAAISGPSPTTSAQGQGLANDYYDDKTLTDQRETEDRSHPKEVRGFGTQRPNSSSSSDTSDSDSESDTEATTDKTSSREIRKKERRVRKAERRLHRATSKAERNATGDQQRDLDMRRVKRAAERLTTAQRRLEGVKA